MWLIERNHKGSKCSVLSSNQQKKNMTLPKHSWMRLLFPFHQALSAKPSNWAFWSKLFIVVFPCFVIHRNMFMLLVKFTYLHLWWILSLNWFDRSDLFVYMSNLKCQLFQCIWDEKKKTVFNVAHWINVIFKIFSN